MAFRLTVGLRVSIVTVLAATSAQATTFNEALESAYTHNPRIMAERQRQEQTDEGVSQALSNLRPNANARYVTGRQRTSFDSNVDAYENYDEKSLTISQPLFRGGGTWASYNAAKQLVKAGEHQLSGLEQQVLMDAITAYADVAANRAILKLAQNNYQTLEKQLKAAQERFALGEVTRTDVAQSQARLSQAKSQLVTAEGRVISAHATFERVVGQKPMGTLDLPEQLPELPVQLDEALERARSQNPQLLTAIHSAKSASYDIDTTMATLLPQVALTGSLSRQTGTGALGNSSFDQDRIGIEVTIPLYRSGAEYSRVREAKSAARQRKHESLDAQQQVAEVVMQSWERLETATANITIRKEQVTAAQTSLTGVREEQLSGTRTVLEVLDAELELFNANSELVRARRDRVVAAFTLAMHLGQLTPTNLSLSTAPYDAKEHYNDVKWQPIGF